MGISVRQYFAIIASPPAASAALLNGKTTMAARALGPGNKSRDDSLGVTGAQEVLALATIYGMLAANRGYIRGQAVTVAFNPAELPDLKLRRLYDYWRSLCRGGRLPSRRDIDPLDIPDLLSNIFLLDVIGDAEDFVFRLAGSLVEDAFSMPLAP